MNDHGFLITFILGSQLIAVTKVDADFVVETRSYV